MERYWTVPPEWPGATVFILAGGPSVAGWKAGEVKDKKGRITATWPELRAQDLSLLKGRRVIAVNSSVHAWPDADFLFFADARWWHRHGPLLKGFQGRIVTIAKSLGEKRILTLQKAKPPGLSTKRNFVTMQRTSLHGAINLAVHLGARRLVLIGADMRAAPDGRTHHHKPHPWAVKPDAWDKQMDQLRTTRHTLDEMGIATTVCSASSRIDWWPRVDRLEDCL